MVVGKLRRACESGGLEAQHVARSYGRWYYEASGAHPIIGPRVSVASDLRDRSLPLHHAARIRCSHYFGSLFRIIRQDVRGGLARTRQEPYEQVQVAQ